MIANYYSVNDIVVTADGKVGMLLGWEIVNQPGGPQLGFITDIPNDKTEHTMFFKDEIEVISKKFLNTLNK
jgi:hypothetical protein